MIQQSVEIVPLVGESVLPGGIIVEAGCPQTPKVLARFDLHKIVSNSGVAGHV